MTADTRKLGTFEGVFTPTLLPILGVILYLRLGWVVGNVGLLYAIIIIVLAHLATITTGLSMSSMATNIKVGAGGFYSIITKSLGIEAAGAIGIPLFLSQALSTALYVAGFTEVLRSFFPDISSKLIASIILLVLFGLANYGAKFVMKIQYLIMAIIGLSLVVFFAGSGNSEGITWVTNGQESFWLVFAVFFPAVTGISTGVALSGDLKNPRKSIPVGMMTAIAVGFIIYIACAYFLAREANSEELVSNYLIMKQIAIWSPLIIAGVLGATFSSALGSILAAPRILMALGQDHTLPFSKLWAKQSKSGEAIYSLFFTVIIIEISLLLGELNTIAPLLTMFFLITYGSINFSVFIEKIVGITSFRPGFAIPTIIPLIGGIWCFTVMFLINSIFAAIALLVIVGIYIIQIKRGLSIPRGDVRSAIFNMVAEWSASVSANMPRSAKIWKPNILIPIDEPEEWKEKITLVEDIVQPRGSLRLISLRYKNNQDDKDKEINGIEKEELTEKLASLLESLENRGIYTEKSVIYVNDFLEGLSVITQVTKSMHFAPNILFLSMSDNPAKLPLLKEMISIGVQSKLGILLLADKLDERQSQERTINLWVIHDYYNRDLATLIAIEMSHKNDTVRLIRVTPKNTENQKEALEKMRIEERLPLATQTQVLEGEFMEVLDQAPEADINIFGMPRSLNVEKMQNIKQTINTTCLFALDSGEESIHS
jgi:amino acid transporter